MNTRDLLKVAGELPDEAYMLLKEVSESRVRYINRVLHRQPNTIAVPCTQADYTLIGVLVTNELIQIAKDSKLWPGQELRWVTTPDGNACLSLRKSLEAVAEGVTLRATDHA